MSDVRVIEVHESVFEANDKLGDETREMLEEQGTFFVNVMSSPGSGKTTLLSALINQLKDEYRIGEMDVDIDSSIDAQRVADATGVDSLQIHNGGLCHIDAEMTSRALMEYGTDYDLLILENIGNLVCPAEFDTGAHKNLMILSVPEGDDKPLKYPLMFSICDVVIFNKMDALPYFDFDVDLAKDHIRKLNPDVIFFEISAKTGAGVDQLADWFRGEIAKLKK